MDGRRQRIGEHAAATSPQWAVSALGPVPADPADRLEWERRAAHVGGYRELYGWEHPSEPCGPEPAGDSPEKRAAWHAAYAAMTRTDSLDLRGEADGTLFHMRGTYEAETSWAPPHVAGQLRAVRSAIIDTAAASARADAEAAAARDRGERELGRQHQDLAESSRALEAFYRQREAIDAGLMEDYQAWEKVTAGSRHVGVLADAELRRRHAGLDLDPLRSAEPAAPAAEVPELPGSEAELLAIAEQARLQRQAFRDRLEEVRASRSQPKIPTMRPTAKRGQPHGRGATATLSCNHPSLKCTRHRKSSVPPIGKLRSDGAWAHTCLVGQGKVVQWTARQQRFPRQGARMSSDARIAGLVRTRTALTVRAPGWSSTGLARAAAILAGPTVTAVTTAPG